MTVPYAQFDEVPPDPFRAMSTDQMVAECVRLRFIQRHHHLITPLNYPELGHRIRLDALLLQASWRDHSERFDKQTWWLGPDKLPAQAIPRLGPRNQA